MIRISGRNVLLTDDKMVVKLIDFGISQQLGETTKMTTVQNVEQFATLLRK